MGAVTLEQLPLPTDDDMYISPHDELGAIEALWSDKRMTVKRMADLFRDNPGKLPSELVERSKIEEMKNWIAEHFYEKGIEQFGIEIHQSAEYRMGLRDAQHPIELLTYLGSWSWTESPSVAVVGTRKPSDEGRIRCEQLVRHLAEDGFTIVSGLAEGIDTVAHTTALNCGAPTYAVIGTPICETYPPANVELQKAIASKYCVISQIPIWRYHQHRPKVNRSWFPERNKTMSALTMASVIVEASDSSGTLHQARAAIRQKRKLFILDSCFGIPGITWPETMLKRGAIRVARYEDIRNVLRLPPRVI